jgi:hypothetical protein
MRSFLIPFRLHFPGERIVQRRTFLKAVAASSLAGWSGRVYAQARQAGRPGGEVPQSGFD